MTKIEIIKSMPGEPRSVVAAAAGCDPQYVSHVRWRTRDPQADAKWRQGIARWQRNNKETVLANSRDHYHRTKVLGGPQAWTPTLDLELKHRINSGQTFKAIADAMGFGRNAIAGRVHRLKKSGALS